MKVLPTKPLRRCALALAIAAAFFAAGCGETVIDTDKTEDTLKASLEKSFHEEVKSVECPSDQKVEAGATFECKVVFADGERETYTLEIRNADADVSIVAPKGGG